MSYIVSTSDDNVNESLKRIFPRIDMDKINDFIDSIDVMSKVRRQFYKKIINYRYNILKRVFKTI